MTQSELEFGTIDWTSGRTPAQLTADARAVLVRELMAEGARVRRAYRESRKLMLKSQLVIEL